MTAGGVIPTPHERARVTEIGRVMDLSGLPLTLGVTGNAVTLTINGQRRRLTLAQCETFTQLFVRAVWLAARDKED